MRFNYRLTISYLSLILAFSSCDTKQEPEQEMHISDSFFNNDSAQNSLLTTYLNEKPDQYAFSMPEAETAIQYDFDEVAPLFKQYCIPCHHSSGGAPFSLESYSSIRKRSKAIKEALISKIMPPWKADNFYNHYNNSQDIPDSLREKMIHWINQGCSKKDKSWKNHEFAFQPKIDFNYFLPKTPIITVKNDSDGFQFTVIDPHFKEDTYVNGIEFISSNPSILHHYGLMADTTGLLLNDSSSKYNAKVNYGQLLLIDAWAKGMKPFKFQRDIALRLPKKTKFLLETHFHGYGNIGKKEQCKIAFHTVKKPNRIVEWKVLKNSELNIPAHEVLTQSIIHTFESDITIIGIIPHTHYLAQKIEAFVITPTKEKINLLHIPEWSYVVQNKYMFENDIKIPKGSTFYLNTVYDNTENNPEQPNKKIRNIKFGRSSYDEMLTCALITYSK
ncbi:MAG: hypothetical protein JKY48_09450 [Flavobacteriales bacterium]|nr:hypothetical protein [Flavobacteriales bacterium]